jgi:hypothetical protein
MTEFHLERIIHFPQFVHFQQCVHFIPPIIARSSDFHVRLVERLLQPPRSASVDRWIRSAILQAATIQSKVEISCIFAARLSMVNSLMMSRFRRRLSPPPICRRLAGRRPVASVVGAARTLLARTDDVIE